MRGTKPLKGGLEIMFDEVARYLIYPVLVAVATGLWRQLAKIQKDLINLKFELLQINMKLLTEEKVEKMIKQQIALAKGEEK